MMPHIQEAMDDPGCVNRIAKDNNPAWLESFKDQPFLVLCSVAARGYWIQINGHWYEKTKVYNA